MDALTDMDRNPGDICEGDAADERLSLESLKKVVAIAPLLPAPAPAPAAATAVDEVEWLEPIVLLLLELPVPLLVVLLLAPADPPVIHGATCCIKEAAVEGGW